MTSSDAPTSAFPDNGFEQGPPGFEVSVPSRQGAGRRVGVFVAVALIALLLIGSASAGVILLHRTGQSAASQPPANLPQTPAVVPPTPTVTVTASPASSAPAATGSPSAAAPPEDFAAVYRSDANGVVRIDTTACNGGGVGSGFLVGPRMVATVAHVVSGAVSIAVREAGITTTGVVVGYDPAHELALIRTSAPLPGHTFNLEPGEPQVGTDIGAIGYPLGGSESLSRGTISGLGRTITVNGQVLHNLVQTDASINPGNSGGPLLTADGTVAGLVEAKRTDATNIGYAIPTSLAAHEILAWKNNPQQVRWSTGCDYPTGPNGENVDITDNSGNPDGAGLVQSFSTYINGIDTGDYATAYSMLSPAEQRKITYDSFSTGNASSYIVTLNINAVTTDPAGATVDVQFTSVQDPSYGYHGQACSDWTMTYTMLRSGNGWLIDKAKPAPGGPTGC